MTRAAGGLLTALGYAPPVCPQVEFDVRCRVPSLKLMDGWQKVKVDAMKCSTDINRIMDFVPGG